MSKGTYIRTLAEALGERLGVPACLAGLRRLGAGALDVDDPRALHPTATPRASEGPARRWSIVLDDHTNRTDPTDLAERLHDAVIPIDQATTLPTFAVDLDDELLRRLEQGQAIACVASPEGGGLAAFTAPLADGAQVVVVARDRERRLRRWILTDLVRDTDPRLRPQRVLTLPGPVDNSAPSA